MTIRRLALVLVVACLAWACGAKKKVGIAELTKAEGPVERQPGMGSWQGATIGATYFMGDAARTADGAAQITLSGGQVLEMQPHTVLRFGPGKNNATNIVVELGAIDVINTATAALAIGIVAVGAGGRVRITQS
ncbi:MAG: hypothetical protein ABI678_06665, partial [Kofleriaceae bacterium]